MNIAILVLSIVAIVCFIIGAFLFFHFAIFKRTIKNKAAEKSTLLFALNVKERKVRSLQTKFHERSGLFDLKSGKWQPTSDLLAYFDDMEIHRHFREAMHTLESGADTTKFLYVSKPHTIFKKESLIEFTFNRMSDSYEYTFVVKWEPVNKNPEKAVVLPTQLTLDDIANDKSMWKGFIAFNTVSDVKDATDKFINLIYRLVKKDSIRYVVISGYVVFMLTAPSEKLITKKINQFITMMENQGFKRGANHLFDGSAFVTSDKVTSVKAIGGVVKALDYFVNKSIKEKLNFISFGADYDRDEFNSFVEASKSFRLATRTGDVKQNKVVVRSWKSKRKTIEYVFPSVDGINQKLLNTILRNKNNKEQLINANARNIAINQQIDLPVLVDINASWFLENKANMVYQKAIYVINLNHTGSTDKLRESLSEMKAKGFVFALRLTQLNEDITLLIQNTKPGFIVIDHSFWGVHELFSTSLLIQLMTIRKLAVSSNIKMIYEDPSEFVDEETAQKIGLDFYYNIATK